MGQCSQGQGVQMLWEMSPLRHLEDLQEALLLSLRCYNKISIDHSGLAHI